MLEHLALTSRLSRRLSSPWGKACERPRHLRARVVLAVVAIVAGVLTTGALARIATPAAAAPVNPTVSITNVDPTGHPNTRFATSGTAVDAHDGQIQQFTYQGTTRYYWYGTQNDCGIGWLRTAIAGAAHPTPWCGYGVYASDDLTTWTYEGQIASGLDPAMQQTCGWNSCWRPRVVFDPNTDSYVAWGNTLQGPSGYSTWTSPSPTGPWTFRGNPRVTTNVGGIGPLSPGNQDMALFVDSRGIGYVVITDAWTYTPVVEQLDPDFLNSTGAARRLPTTQAEAPSMFEHGGRYYVFVSQPNGGYVPTGTAYLWATDPLGPWTYGGELSSDSFGGQPTFAATWRTTDGRSIEVFQSDLWYHPGMLERNQGLAGFNVSPITWNSDGVTPALPAAPTWSEQLRFVDTGATDLLLPHSGFHAPDTGDWYVTCDVRSGHRRAFTFQATSSGVLTDLSVPIARSEYPTDEGHLSLAAGTNTTGAPELARATIASTGAGWTARPYVWHPNVTVTAGATYTVTLRSADTGDGQSCYGFTYRAGSTPMGLAYTAAGGAFSASGETVKFDLAIRPVVPRGATVVAGPTRLASASLEAGYRQLVRVAGVAGIPPVGVIGAWVNLTVSGATTSGSLVAFAGDGPASTVNPFRFSAGQTRSFAALVRVGYDGTIAVGATANARVDVDLTAWVMDDTVDAANGRLEILTDPVRATDTRTSGQTLGPGGRVDVQITGGLVPATATAALVNVVAVHPSSATSLAAFATGRTDPGLPTVVTQGGVLANRALVALSDTGRLTIANAAGSVDVLVDVIGYVAAGAGPTGDVAPLDPVALSTPDPGADPATFALTPAPLVTVAGTPGFGAALVALTQTMADPGFGIVYRTGQSLPATTDLNAPGGGAPVTNLGAVALRGATSISAIRQSAVGTSAVAVTGWVIGTRLPGPPSAPLAASATAGSGTATVTWRPPADLGGTPLVRYTARATPSGAACGWEAGPRSGPLACTLTALPDGVAQIITVTATNAAGTSPASAPTAAVVPVGSGYAPLPPTRVLDTRFGPVPAGSPGLTPVVGGVIWTLPLGGTAGIPTDATAVVLNVTATDVSTSTFVSVWPAGSPLTTSSSLNVSAGDTRANLVTVALGARGSVNLISAFGTSNLVVDVQGYYAIDAANRFTPLTPARLLDTREPPARRVGSNQSVTVPVRGRGGVPADARAVVVNITATNVSAPTVILATPTGTSALASNLNVGPGYNRPNLAVVPVGDGGAITLWNMFGSVDLVVDVVGAFGPSGTDLFDPRAPVRVLDTRAGPVPASWGPPAPVGPGQVLTLALGGPAGVPANATAVLLNVVATEGTAPTFVTVWPAGVPQPNASSLNALPGETGANLVSARLGTGQAVAMFNLFGTTHLVADLSGWYYH